MVFTWPEGAKGGGLIIVFLDVSVVIVPLDLCMKHWGQPGKKHG